MDSLLNDMLLCVTIESATEECTNESSLTVIPHNSVEQEHFVVHFYFLTDWKISCASLLWVDLNKDADVYSDFNTFPLSELKS